MKLHFSIFALLVSSIAFCQLEGLTLSDIVNLNRNDYQSSMGYPNRLIIPEGKLYVPSDNTNTNNITLLKVGIIDNLEESVPFNSMYYTSGMELVFSSNHPLVIQFLVYDLPSSYSGTVGLQEETIEIEKLRLFPNPTDSRLAINSDEIFRIEVYDLNGKKLIETNDNRIDFSELSNAVYLVKLFDDSNKIVSTYKIIKK